MSADEYQEREERKELNKKKGPPGVEVHIIKASSPTAPVEKAAASTQISGRAATNASDWLEPPANLKGYKTMVAHSSILPQCVRAYKNNIAGFGIGVRYKSGYDDNDKEALAEYNRMEEIIQLLNMDVDTKEVFEDVLEARETYGIGYLEVVRNLDREVVGIEFIRDTASVSKTAPLEPYVDVEYYFNKQMAIRPRKFCKYRQQVGGKTVYLKEIGDPRIMSKLTGEYIAEGETLNINEQANEIMEFAIGTEAYGEVRWTGQIIGVDGSRKAEGLNNRYFEEGRHTPMLIMVRGGRLTDDSFSKLQEYMNGIKGEAGQHAFMLLEVESNESGTAFDETPPPEVEIKDLASVLQKDELFQDYLDNSRRRVQSAFQLPDLYVGYTTDFNRATAQTAQEITEKQVFQPERTSLAWAVNNKLLAGYQFQYVEAYFKGPDISNIEELFKILTLCNMAGGLTPNKAKEIAYKLMGETSTDFEEEWGEIPLPYTKALAATALGGVGVQLDAQIQKAVAEHGNNDAVVAVMKEVRALLEDIGKQAS